MVGEIPQNLTALPSDNEPLVERLPGKVILYDESWLLYLYGTLGDY